MFRLLRAPAPLSRRNYSHSRFNQDASITTFVAVTALLAPVLFSQWIQRNENQDDSSSRRLSKLTEDSNIPAKYVLIGAGAASFSALQSIRSQDPDCKVVMIGDEPVGPYLRPPLSKELFSQRTGTGSQKLSEMFYKDWQGTEQSVALTQQSLPYELLTGTPVSHIDVKEKYVQLVSGEKIHFTGAALIATGGRPRLLQGNVIVDESAANFISYFRTFQDFTALKSVAKGKRICILGGSFLGSELALGLSSNDANSVTQIFSENGNMCSVLPQYLSEWTTSMLMKHMTILPNTRISRIDKISDTRVAVVTDFGDKFEVDHIVVAHGIVPNCDVAVNSGLPVDANGIVADEYLCVAHGIFAAGDVVSFPDALFGRRRVEHYLHAVESGHCAGQNMVAHNQGKGLAKYNTQPMFWSSLGSAISYEAVGITDSRLPTVSVWATAKDNIENEGTIDDIMTPVLSRGVIFYLSSSDSTFYHNNQIIGMLTFNMHGQSDLMKRVLESRQSEADIPAIVQTIPELNERINVSV